MMQMMERMNFVMGNVCDRLHRVEKHGNMAGTSTQDVRKLGAEQKANSSSRVESSGRTLMILVMVVLRMRP